ncbi:hypothetical protein [Chryseobacterium sp. MYb328]|uniref:hypothetical protein n=1 Tax=Chryseobacterium sp. MYb328 TaxID=2745231 RepID=UPI0030B3CB25
MKTNYLFYALICIVSVGKIKAADLYVRDLGAGGAYSTISAAITAASDGDRIIIKPKIGNVPYLENLSINKSLTFTSENNFSKYYVQGTISVVPGAGRVVNIHNMYAFQSGINATSTIITGGRCTINIVNSIADKNLDLDVKNVTANIYGSTFTNLDFMHGKIMGNTCSYIYLQKESAPSVTSAIYIAGNKISTIIGYSSYPVNILNNELESSITMQDMLSGSTNIIQHNLIKIGSITANSDNPCIVIVENNIINPGSTNHEIFSNVTPTVIASYNLSTSAFTTYNVDIQNNNISSGSYTLDLANFTSSGDIVNAGRPEEEYQDLDLTRSDIGPLGGSNSWANYWPTNAGNKPRVMFLNTPRRVYLGTSSIQAEATGISK